MEFSSQVSTFAVTIATGAFIGLFFDFYRVIYSLFRPRRMLTYITDLLFWMVATAITFGALLICNWGELRAYVFFGLIGGAVLYFRLVSGAVRISILKILRLIHMIMLWISRLLLLTVWRPVVWIVTMMLKPFLFTKRRTAAWCKDHFKRPPDENIPPNP